MFRAAGLLLLCATRTVFGIIVEDSVPPGEEYKYLYEIEDTMTGDSKRLLEAWQGGAVRGHYTVLDPNGMRRMEHYTVDPHSGFKAVLVHEPVPITQFISREYIAFEDQLRPVFAQRTQHTDPYLPLQPTRHHSKTYRRDKYFTPANELLLEKAPINGLYFEPSKKYE